MTEGSAAISSQHRVRDRNRNELLSLGWRPASAGIENALAITGDYPPLQAGCKADDQ
jgi:hypothetical protein